MASAESAAELSVEFGGHLVHPFEDDLLAVMFVLGDDRIQGGHGGIVMIRSRAHCWSRRRRYSATCRAADSAGGLDSSPSRLGTSSQTTTAGTSGAIDA